MTDTPKARQARKARRALVDGRLVAVDAPEHGKPSTYSNWGYRCERWAWAAYAAARSRATPYPKPRRRATP